MNKITQIVENYLSSDLILMDISEDTRGKYIRVVIDAERPVTLDDTTNLSKKLRVDDELDIRFPGGFRLEVTTPGLDKALESPFQFRKNINRELKVTFSNDDDDDTQTITGTLIDANDTCVNIRESGQEFSLGYDQINSAKVLISFN
jgi:ribosome maturation factor RimP